MSDVLRIDMQEVDMRCEVCRNHTRGLLSIPTFNGDVVSNDFWHQDWEHNGGYIHVCPRCFHAHADGQVVTYDHLYRQERRTGEDLQDGAGI